MNFEELLDEDLVSEMRKLRTTPYDDKNYGTVADTVVKLMDRKIEIEKSKNEQLFREQQVKDEKKDRLIKNIISAAGVVLPIIVTVWGVKASFEFEKEGTVTTIMGRGLISKLVPKK
jgi:hypothetical protein